MINSPTLRRLAGNDSYTFLMQELEKIDEKILEPLSGTDWPRDMPVITGGGLIESISSIDVTYASTGRDDDNLFFEAANDIPVIQADMSKQVARTFNWAEYMAFTHVDTVLQSVLLHGRNVHILRIMKTKCWRPWYTVIWFTLCCQITATIHVPTTLFSTNVVNAFSRENRIFWKHI
jgi:hypothetical protein